MLLLDPASDLHTTLAGLAERARAIFVAGLPGTGKSLLIHQLVQLAHRQGRASRSCSGTWRGRPSRITRPPARTRRIAG